MSASDISDIDAVDALKLLRRKVAREHRRTVERSDTSGAHLLHREMDALDRAMAMLGNRHGEVLEGRTRVALDERDLVELIALIRDEDGTADEAVLDDLEERLVAVLRGLLRRTLTQGVAA